MLTFNKNIKIGNRMIGPDYPTYFIAEIGGNFDGSLDKAKRLIDAAKEAGADCAKFQTFKAESIVSEGGFSKMTLHGVHGSWGRTVSEVFKDVEFPIEWHQEIADYCKNVGIDFSTSPYFKEAVDLCADMNLPFIKIGSGEITWLEMLDYTARKGLPVMLATGDATMSEIDEAVRTIEKTGNKDLVLMQCITNYPSKIDSANVNVLKTYQSAYDCLTGYSDHSPGHVVALASVVLGGRVIEKHFTLNKKDKGPDHPHSMEPNEFKFMVDSIREVERAMGSTRKEVVAEESETVFVQRRCLYAKNALKKGQVITEADIDVLRPALGIPPKFKDTIIGKAVNKDIPANDPIFWEDI
ncbi:N-acetylneuraminate synthase [Xylanibacter ruminicola]|jgi:N-acetylneuraminate synthase|uniref:N-acetylneuraminate synthase n=1 Tax=Xylanibacter ruminicola TaxID=839 RepID=A0A1H5SGG0_XYLRU|nr:MULTISPECIES: N-acetylneuraminate synthase family protein [Prevotellaceae]MCR5471266.1 N-acetylneuraminate synthase family protein [Prevotella sp.]SEF49530.1 N-acetylneuraminate synthase [Xylanibacter ruminicola]